MLHCLCLGQVGKKPSRPLPRRVSSSRECTQETTVLYKGCVWGGTAKCHRITHRPCSRATCASVTRFRANCKEVTPATKPNYYFCCYYSLPVTGTGSANAEKSLLPDYSKKSNTFCLLFHSLFLSGHPTTSSKPEPHAQSTEALGLQFHFNYF